jgi:hypothetical protein
METTREHLLAQVPSGWQGDKCDADVDDCNAVNNPCDTTNNQKCVNTAGSYICQCVTGYHNVSGTCTSKCSLPGPQSQELLQLSPQ